MFLLPFVCAVKNVPSLLLCKCPLLCWWIFTGWIEQQGLIEFPTIRLISSRHMEPPAQTYKNVCMHIRMNMNMIKYTQIHVHKKYPYTENVHKHRHNKWFLYGFYIVFYMTTVHTTKYFAPSFALACVSAHTVCSACTEATSCMNKESSAARSQIILIMKSNALFIFKQSTRRTKLPIYYDHNVTIELTAMFISPDVIVLAANYHLQYENVHLFL